MINYQKSPAWLNSGSFFDQPKAFAEVDLVGMCKLNSLQSESTGSGLLVLGLVYCVKAPKGDHPFPCR